MSFLKRLWGNLTNTEEEKKCSSWGKDELLIDKH